MGNKSMDNCARLFFAETMEASNLKIVRIKTQVGN